MQNMKIKQFLIPFLEVFEILAVVLVSIYVIYGFIAQPFLVQGASMQPNFYSGDYLLVDEATYHFRSPERGEVIVFHNPNNPAEFYIKRVVGLPGEEVVINDGKVLINGKVLDESYLPQGLEVNGQYVFQLGQDEYFVMGDNRPQSYDSRSWGPLEKSFIVGVVRLRFWPPNEFSSFSYES